MEKKQETKKTKSLTQKAKKIRSVVMMTLLCVLLMSAATYAWFTLSNTSKVSNMTMTVGDVTGLQVADVTDANNTNGPTQESEWVAATKAVTFKGKLLPAHSDDGISIYEPVYDESGAVSSLSGTASTKKLTRTSEANDEGYFVEHTFWIRAQGPNGGKTKVQLDKGENLNSGIYEENTGKKAAGTYSLSKAPGKNGILPSAAVRISLSAAGGSTKIFEPNSDFDSVATEKATDNSQKNVPANTITQSYTSGEITSTDKIVFELENNKATLITLRLWLEGVDQQCGNEISAKDIISQLKFSTVKETSTT